MPAWRNRQTHQVESLATARSWGIEAPRRYQSMREYANRQSGLAQTQVCVRSNRTSRTSVSITGRPRSWLGERTTDYPQLKGIRHTSLTQNQRLLRSNRRLGTTDTCVAQ
jgi:hypothetical protein